MRLCHGRVKTSPFLSSLLLLQAVAAAALAQEVNVARGKLATASAAVYGGYPAGNVTDGNRATFSHPDNPPVENNFYYQVDLGAAYGFDRLVFFNRDNCCPERLSNYRVQLFADAGGAPGAVNWTAIIRGDGTNSGIGGSDIVRAAAGTGTFAGRFIRVGNVAGMDYNPQIAEIEAYAAPAPVIRFFQPNVGNIAPGGTATLSWQVENFTTLAIDQGIGSVPGPSGSVSVTPGATTTYTLTASNAATSATGTVTIGVGETQVAPVLNELLADNEGNLADQDGTHSDWIELRNPNVFTLNLEGHYLTDNAALPTKWRFPSVAVPPGGFLVVFASEKALSDPAGPVHTNFKLPKSGQYLGLVAPDGTTVLDQFAPGYPEQFADKSFGRTASGELRYFSPPTPGAANGTGFEGVVADTQFSVPRGFYSTAQAVALTTATPGATIRYTTNGTVPTLVNGSTYSAPLTINTTTILRAAAFKTNQVATNTDTQSYIFLSQVVAALTPNTAVADRPNLQPGLADLPSISLVLPQTGDINDNTEVPLSFEVLHPDNSPGAQNNAGVIQYGGAFTFFAKKNFRLYFRGEYGSPKLRHPLFAGHERDLAARAQFDQLELRGGSHDMAERGFYMSNTFTDDTMLDMGNVNPHSRYVHLYLNGAYHGMYHLRERWGAKMLADYLGGPDESYEAINGNYNVGGWADPGSAYDGDGSAWARIKSLRSNYAAVRPYLDVPHFIDYMTMWMFGNAEDEYRTAGPKGVGSGFKWFLNDADGYLATGSYDSNNTNNTGRANPPPGRGPADGPGSLFSTLFVQADPDYRTLLADRIHRHFVMPGGVLTPAKNAARLSGRTTEVQRAIVAECARWGYRTPSNWAAARDVIFNSWFPSRTTEVLNQFRTAGFYPSLNAPVFSQHGGAVSSGFVVNMPAPAGATVWFTIDGTDPRLPGGANSPTAVSGTSTVITQNTILRARAKSGAQWSALNEAFFAVGDVLPGGAVAISELNYHPAGDLAGEFIELTNLSTQAINLRGARFGAGIEFAFPVNRDVPLAAGARLLLVENQLAFEARYGLGLPIAGVYRGNLDNDGEVLGLQRADGVSLVNFAWDNGSAWPLEADGEGRTLVLANRTPGANPNDPINWRASTAPGGDPGAGDSASFAGGDLLRYALTGDSPLLAPSITRTLEGALFFTHRRNLRADDIAYAVEVSTDLRVWMAGAATLSSQTVAGDGVSTMTWRIPPSPDPTKYVRLRVTSR